MLSDACIALLPANSLPLIPLNTSKTEGFSQHLKSITDQFSTMTVEILDQKIADEVDRRFVHEATEESLVNHACGTCQGYCCVTVGTKNAFIDATVIRRYCLSNPLLLLKEIREHYLRFLPETHMEKSCLYHSEKGCCLPRSMRANICNEYYCPDLRDLLNLQKKGNPAKKILTAAVQKTELIRTRLFDICLNEN